MVEDSQENEEDQDEEDGEDVDEGEEEEDEVGETGSQEDGEEEQDQEQMQEGEDLDEEDLENTSHTLLLEDIDPSILPMDILNTTPRKDAASRPTALTNKNRQPTGSVNLQRSYEICKAVVEKSANRARVEAQLVAPPAKQKKVAATSSSAAPPVVSASTSIPVPLPPGATLVVTPSPTPGGPKTLTYGPPRVALPTPSPAPRMATLSSAGSSGVTMVRTLQPSSPGTVRLRLPPSAVPISPQQLQILPRAPPQLIPVSRLAGLRPESSTCLTVAALRQAAPSPSPTSSVPPSAPRLLQPLIALRPPTGLSPQMMIQQITKPCTPPPNPSPPVVSVIQSSSILLSSSSASSQRQIFYRTAVRPSGSQQQMILQQSPPLSSSTLSSPSHVSPLPPSSPSASPLNSGQLVFTRPLPPIHTSSVKTVMKTTLVPRTPVSDAHIHSLLSAMVPEPPSSQPGSFEDKEQASAIAALAASSLDPRQLLSPPLPSPTLPTPPSPLPPLPSPTLLTQPGLSQTSPIHPVAAMEEEDLLSSLPSSRPHHQPPASQQVLLKLGGDGNPTTGSTMMGKYILVQSSEGQLIAIPASSLRAGEMVGGGVPVRASSAPPPGHAPPPPPARPASVDTSPTKSAAEVAEEQEEMASPVQPTLLLHLPQDQQVWTPLQPNQQQRWQRSRRRWPAQSSPPLLPHNSHI